MELDKYRLILGSQSPRRKELLSWTNISYEIVVADLDEISNQIEPYDVATDIAKQKAEAVFKKCNDENSFVISSDTIVVLGDKIYGKPKDREDAKKILLELSNKTHQVITGVVFMFKDKHDLKIKTHTFYDLTEVTFNEITPDLMENYLNTNDSLDKAGAYGIQGPSLTFISKLSGSYSNVVGFPLDKVISELIIIFGDNWRKRFL